MSSMVSSDCTSRRDPANALMICTFIQTNTPIATSDRVHIYLELVPGLHCDHYHEENIVQSADAATEQLCSPHHHVVEEDGGVTLSTTRS